MTWLVPPSQTTRVSVGAGNDLYVDPTTSIVVSGDFAVVDTNPTGRIIVEGTLLSNHLQTLVYNIGSAATGSALIEIADTGRIRNFGGDATVSLVGNGFTLVNRGQITSFDAIGVRLNGDTETGHSTITNIGTIDVGGIAVARFGTSNDETILLNNSGLIRGTAAAYGQMSGAPASGRDLITNSGRIVGDLNLLGGSDSYSGAAGHLIGRFLGGAGIDLAIGGSDNDWFEGGTESDTLRGQGGSDRLIGDAGADTLFGGLGADVLTGGADSDRFVFDSKLGSTNVDTIADFNTADTILLQNAVLTKLTGLGTLSNAQFWKSATGLAHDANDRIVYETDTGKLFYDSNGNAAGGRVQIAVLTGHPTITNADFFII